MPAPSSIITSGVRFAQLRAARLEFAWMRAAVPIDPPATVKSLGADHHGRPVDRPGPGDEASAGNWRDHL
ncbi:hypothetical protein GS491_26970 [Rhodococcus hoagii]|nr:hypothetical protein [Prescottella equi]